MVKTNIKILNFKDMDKNRTVFTTDTHGIVSVFKNEGETLIEDLKSHTDRLISVEISPSKKLKTDGTPFMNIRKFYGAVAGNPVSEPQIETIEPKAFGVEKKDLFNERDKDTAFYTAYAKDVFIAMLSTITTLVDADMAIPAPQIMEKAIEVVKQARDAFSQ